MRTKDRYTFSGHSDYAKRFGNAVHVGETESGKSVWAWRDGLWTVYSTTGFCVGYVANRISAAELSRPHDTRVTHEALQHVITAMESR